MALREEVRQWDGKSADDISGIFQKYCKKPEFLGEVLESISAQETERGMTWLLKAWFESGGRLDSEQITQIYQSIAELDHWEAKLHVLQSMPYMPVSKANKKKVESFLRETLIDHNKFVRAWTYNGFHLLAQQHPEYRQEVDQFFEMAMRDEAASVKARIRNIRRTK